MISFGRAEEILKTFSAFTISEKGERRSYIMATSSITHNFVISKKDSAERFAEALEKPKIQKTDINIKTVSGSENVRLLAEKWKTGIK